MSQCVPSWDIDDPPPNNPSNFPLHLFHPPGAPSDDPLELRTDYEVAELTWENGHLALHGLVPPRAGKPAPKATPSPPPPAAWNKQQHHLAGGTLESVVNQATGAAAAALAGAEIEDWFGGLRQSAVAVDALVPCQDEAADSRARERDAAGGRRRERMVGVCSSQGSAAGSVAAGRVESTTLVTLGTCMEDDVGLTATATTATTATATNSVSPGKENSSLGKRKAIAVEDHVSISHGCSQSKEEKDNKTEADKPSTSAKKSRAAAVHNQSERKRRDRINQKMKTLQKLVPNSSKTDKASMLDEVIEYLKQLQAQVQMMRMNNMSVMMPMAMPQLQMPAMMAGLAQLPQMGMGIGMMDLASIGRSMTPTLPLLHPSAFLSLAAGTWDGASGSDRRPSSTVLPVDPFAALLACQMPQQPMSLDEYSKMASVLQKLYQQQQPQPPPAAADSSS